MEPVIVKRRRPQGTGGIYLNNAKRYSNRPYRATWWENGIRRQKDFLTYEEADQFLRDRLPSGRDLRREQLRRVLWAVLQQRIEWATAEIVSTRSQAYRRWKAS